MRIAALVMTSALVMASLGCSADADPEEAAAGAGELSQVKSASFDCKTTGDFYGKKAHTFQFSAAGLNTNSPGWTGVSGEHAEDDGPVTFSPKNSPLMYLNENWVIEMQNGALRLWGDGDGFETVEVMIYKDSGFRAGYVKVHDGGEGNGDGYSKLSCTVSDLAKAPAKDPPKADDRKKASGDKCLVDAECASGTCIHGIVEYSCK